MPLARKLAERLTSKKSIVVPLGHNAPGCGYNFSEGGAVVSVLERKVIKPAAFVNYFSKGDKILELHVNALNARDLVKLFRSLKSQVEVWKRKGFAGAYGITPTSPISRFLIREFKAVEIPVPFELELDAMVGYQLGVSVGTLPKKYLVNAPKMLVLKF